jgi:hypothetical protein
MFDVADTEFQVTLQSFCNRIDSWRTYLQGNERRERYIHKQ